MSSIASYLKILSTHSLTELESYACLDTILNGDVTQEDIEKLLILLSDKGETVDEIVGFSRAMRDHMIKLPLSFKRCLDLCGTGGSGQDRFNVSTAAAFFIAAMGYSVAKHGNYGSRRPNGSFNFLEALQVPFQLPPTSLMQQFEKTGLVFLLAKQFHPSMRFVAPARKAVSRRTIFNLLGPLCNPASVTHQMIGTTSLLDAKRISESIQRLGVTKAMVIVGGDGRDELSLTGQNIVLEVTSEQINQWTWESDIPVEMPSLGNSDTNAQLFLEMLRSHHYHHPVMQYIVANVSMALYCLDEINDINIGIKKVNQWMDSNDLLAYLQRFQGLTFS